MEEKSITLVEIVGAKEIENIQLRMKVQKLEEENTQLRQIVKQQHAELHKDDVVETKGE